VTAIIPRFSGGTKKCRRNRRSEKHSQHFAHDLVSSPCYDADVLMTKLRAFFLVAKKGQRVHKRAGAGVGRAGWPSSSPLLEVFSPRLRIGGEAVPFPHIGHKVEHKEKNVIAAANQSTAQPS
jgi:hypothetical protein